MVKGKNNRRAFGGLDALGRLFRHRDIVGAGARPKPGAEYMRGERASIFRSWHPALRDPRDDVRQAYWLATARTIETIHNSGWLAGLVRQARAAILGDGLQLVPLPDREALGWTHEDTVEWARDVRRWFEAWANNPLECDAAGKANLHQQAHAAVGSYFAAGEIVATLRWIARPQSRTRTKIQLVPAHRMTQESNGVDLFQGVRIDANGLPLAYRLRLPTPLIETGAIVDWPARVAGNRPAMLHIFDPEIGQMRGITPFAPVLQRVRQYDQLAQTSLSAELARALYIGTVTSDKPTQEILQAFQDPGEQGIGGSFAGFMSARADYYDNTTFDLNGPAKIVHLFPGETLDLKTGAAASSVYEPTAMFLLREIARCAGHTVEEATGDYRGASYSSIRISTTTVWPITLYRRRHIAAPFYQGAYEAALEEAIDRGDVPFPGGMDRFLANRQAACRAAWRGPPKPQADDLKYAKASETLYRLNATSLQRICGELGEDWEDVLHQLAEEKALREKLGLPEPIVAGSNVIDEDDLDAETGSEQDPRSPTPKRPGPKKPDPEEPANTDDDA